MSDVCRVRFIEVPKFCEISKLVSKLWINVATIRSFSGREKEKGQTYINLTEDDYEILDMTVDEFVVLLNSDQGAYA